MPGYLVESFEPQPDIAGHAGLAEVPGYVRTIHVPEDETTFHVFENTTLDELRDTLMRAQLSYERIVEAQ